MLLVAPGVLLGVEADVSFARIEGSFSRVSPFNTALVAIDPRRFGTVRGRVGAAFGQVLVYGTGGLAWGHMDSWRVQLAGTTNSATAGTVEVSSYTRVGWTAGGGTEVAFTPHWSLKAEYLYADYGKEQFLRPLSLSLAQHHTVMHTGRLGVSFKF